MIELELKSKISLFDYFSTFLHPLFSSLGIPDSENKVEVLANHKTSMDS